MKRPIAYKVPTLIEGIKTPQAKEAMEEWKEWLAYANYLESVITWSQFCENEDL